MIVNEISLWGAALVAILVIIAMIALAFVDSKMLRRMLVIFGATVAQMIVVGAICWVLYPIQFMWKRALKPVHLLADRRLFCGQRIGWCDCVVDDS